jgi:hypothetical protein
MHHIQQKKMKEMFFGKVKFLTTQTMSYHLAELSNLLIFFLVVFWLFTHSFLWLYIATILFVAVHFLNVQLLFTNCKAKRGETALITGASRGIGISFSFDF